MSTISEMLTNAVQLHQSGRLRDAEQIYRQILQRDPRNADALHLMGVIAHQEGRHSEAVEWIERAIGIHANVPDFHKNLGGALLELRKYPEAIASYSRAIQLDRQHAAAHNGLGNALRAQGRFDEAEESCRRAMAIRPDYAEAYDSLGNLLRDQGKYAEAIACFQKALELRPGQAESHNNLANALKDHGKLAEAVECYRKALEIRPDAAAIHHNLGIVLNDLARRDEAVFSFLRALALNPRYAEAHANLGHVLELLGNLDEAVACSQQAIQLKPDLAEAHNHLGTALKKQGKLHEAVACFRRAIELKPSLVISYSNLGIALNELGQHDEAIVSFKRALELNPGFAAIHSNLLMALQYPANVTLASLAEAHAEFDRRHVTPLRSSWVSTRRSIGPERRVRLGFVSADLARHPVGYFLIRVLENLDHSQVETYCYSDRILKDDYTQRFQQAATQWRDVMGVGHEQLAEQIRADQIDILFDLAGHTAYNRMLVFARKPAPIQIAWIGYEGTTGLSSMTYLLADRFVLPPEFEGFYKEKILRMPDDYLCYEPPQNSPEVGPLPAEANGHLTFGSFNNLAKITSTVLDTWSEILRRAPRSRLLMKYRGLGDPQIRQRFLEEFTARGIDPGRLDLLPPSSYNEYLETYHRVDLILDSFPFSGGTTSCDALWMGVPMITCPGETFASRHSLTHLSNIGLTETIAHSQDEYISMAVEWENRLPRLSEIRAGLRDRMVRSPLCDGPRFAENFLKLMRDVHSNTPSS